MGCLPDETGPGLAGLVVGDGDDGVGDADVALFHIGSVVPCEAADSECDMGGVVLLLQGVRGFGRFVLVVPALCAFVGIYVSACSGRALFVAAAHIAVAVAVAAEFVQPLCCSHLVVGFVVRPVRGELVIPMSVQTLSRRYLELGALDPVRNGEYKDMVIIREYRCYSP